MLTSLSPETLGASLSMATLGGLLDVAGFLVFVLLLAWIFSVASPDITTESTASESESASTERPFSPTPSGKVFSGPMQTAMTPLEVDLARVETLPALSTVPPAVLVDELRSDIAANESDISDIWPPSPRRPGAKVYRYVNAGGRLVKLSDLHAVLPYPPSGNMLN